MRCFHTRELGCFRVIGDIAESESGTVSERWRARLDSAELVGPGRIRSDLDNSGTLNLLIVYDVSGSMKGDRMAYTRTAVRDFIAALPGNVTTSVVPFASQQVLPKFQAARFESSGQCDSPARTHSGAHKR